MGDEFRRPRSLAVGRRFVPGGLRFVASDHRQHLHHAQSAVPGVVVAAPGPASRPGPEVRCATARDRDCEPERAVGRHRAAGARHRRRDRHRTGVLGPQLRRGQSRRPAAGAGAGAIAGGEQPPPSRRGAARAHRRGRGRNAGGHDRTCTVFRAGARHAGRECAQDADPARPCRPDVEPRDSPRDPAGLDSHRDAARRRRAARAGEIARK